MQDMNAAMNIENLQNLINIYRHIEYTRPEGLNSIEEASYKAAQELLSYKILEKKGLFVSMICTGCIYENYKSDGEKEPDCVHCARAFSDCFIKNN